MLLNLVYIALHTPFILKLRMWGREARGSYSLLALDIVLMICLTYAHCTPLSKYALLMHIVLSLPISQVETRQQYRGSIPIGSASSTDHTIQLLQADPSLIDHFFPFPVCQCSLVFKLKCFTFSSYRSIQQLRQYNCSQIKLPYLESELNLFREPVATQQAYLVSHQQFLDLGLLQYYWQFIVMEKVEHGMLKRC